jgi:hypothetical protein
VIIGGTLTLLALVCRAWLDGRRELEPDEHEVFKGYQ